MYTSGHISNIIQLNVRQKYRPLLCYNAWCPRTITSDVETGIETNGDCDSLEKKLEHLTTVLIEMDHLQGLLLR